MIDLHWTSWNNILDLTLYSKLGCYPFSWLPPSQTSWGPGATSSEIATFVSIMFPLKSVINLESKPFLGGLEGPLVAVPLGKIIFWLICASYSAWSKPSSTLGCLHTWWQAQMLEKLFKIQEAKSMGSGNEFETLNTIPAIFFGKRSTFLWMRLFFQRNIKPLHWTPHENSHNDKLLTMSKALLLQRSIWLASQDWYLNWHVKIAWLWSRWDMNALSAGFEKKGLHIEIIWSFNMLWLAYDTESHCSQGGLNLYKLPKQFVDFTFPGENSIASIWGPRTKKIRRSEAIK